jgi:hypothetical protein
MKHGLMLGAPLAAALLVGSVLAAEGVRSGPPVGKALAPFNPLNVTGPDANTKTCQV